MASITTYDREDSAEVKRWSNESTWSELRDGAGTDVSNTAAKYIAELYPSPTDPSNTWLWITRGVIIWDLSKLNIPSDATIDAVLYGTRITSKDDPVGWLPSLNIYDVDPSVADPIVAGDYEKCGTTAYSTAKSYGDVVLSTFGSTPEIYNEWTFNSTGIAAAQSAFDGDGLLKFCLRNGNYDVADIEPTLDGTGRRCYFIWENLGLAETSHKLTVWYTVGIGIPGHIWTGQVGGKEFCYIDAAGIKRHIYGTDTLNDGIAGHLWVDGVFVYWIDQNGDIRRRSGVRGGVAGATAAHIWIEGEHFHYIASDGDEYRLPHGSVGNSSAFNTVGFNT
jgi:hypothetical protein